MPLTPADVHNVAFSKPPIGKRGYNEDEVDQFLDLVEDTLEQLGRENEELTAQVSTLSGGQPTAPVSAAVNEDDLRRRIDQELRAEYEQRLAQASAGAANQNDAARALQDLQSRLTAAEQRAVAAEQQNQQLQRQLQAAEQRATEAEQRAQSAGQQQAAFAQPAPSHVEGATQAARVLALAQETADRLTGDARSESDAMLDEARTAAEKTITAANTEATDTLTKARNEAESTLADAKQRSETMLSDAAARAEAQVRQAQDKANALQQQAETKHAEIMATIGKQRTAGESRIEQLKTYEREYRTRLKTFLESQMAELNNQGSAAPNETDDDQ